jgi:hypothetical protein
MKEVKSLDGIISYLIQKHDRQAGRQTHSPILVAGPKAAQCRQFSEHLSGQGVEDVTMEGSISDPCSDIR